MTEPTQPVRPPELADLFARYLHGRVAANEAGLGLTVAGGEVVPHEAVPAQPADPRLAWDEALTAVHYYNPATGKQTWPVPPDWPFLVSASEPVIALAFCLGNYPQLVRNLQPLLHADGWSAQRTTASRGVPVPGLVEWASQIAQEGTVPQRLIAAGALRLARQFDSAGDVLRRPASGVAAEWRAAWANEEAALAWQRGQAEEAAGRWSSMAENVPVLFNRGMAALFLDQPSEARSALAQAAAQLPETDGWHHLARLYLALAESR